MKIIKNSFLTTLTVVVLCLVFVAGLHQYVRSAMLNQYLDKHSLLSTFVIESIDTNDVDKLKQQLSDRLTLLPGWLAAVYDEKGQLLWQSQDNIAGIELKKVNKEQLKLPLLSEEQDWVLSQHLLNDVSTGKHKITVTLFSPKENLQRQIQFVSNLLFMTAIFIGLLIWGVLNLHSRHLKSDIRKYIRANRKEFTHDKLTGLPNREILLDRIEHGLAQAKRNQSQVALIYIALDRFHQINAGFGHAFGDQVLRAVAARLLLASRDSDTLVRVEGDQFVLLMTDIYNQEEPEAVVMRIIKELKVPVDIGRKQCVITASIGISMDDFIDGDHDALIHNAYTAMMEIKQNSNGNGHLFFSPEMNSRFLAKAEKDAEL